MRSRAAAALSLVLLWFLSTGLSAQVPQLQIASAGPNGEVARLSEANEIRVVFSESMVALGRIPPTVTAPFFRIEPGVKGAFRWSGTRTLIFTPAAPFAYGMRYDITVDTSATSESGRRLEKAFRFSFTTPTLSLSKVSWYRKSGRSDSPVVVVLRFNQPVRPESVAAGTRMTYEPHDFTAPVGTNGIDRWKKLDPAGFAAFQAKVERTSAAARSSSKVPFAVAKTWNRKMFPAGKDMAVLETSGTPPVESWIRLELPAGLRGTQGSEGTRTAQSARVMLEPAFFVERFRCDTGCDPDQYNPLRFRSRVTARRTRDALHIADVTKAGEIRPLAPGKRPSAAPSGEEEEGPAPLYPRTPGEDDSPESWSGVVTPEEAGFKLGPARTYRATVDANLRSEDGQILGYTWIGLLENWHQSAFTSFGSGHGVWETGGGPILPFSARNLKTVTQWLAALKLEDLIPAIVEQESKGFDRAPSASGRPRRLTPIPDKIQSYGLDMSGLLSRSGTGLVWAALQDGEPIEKSRHDGERRIQSSLVQVTNLGISVKDSPKNTLVLVTRLDDGQPVAGARVSIRTSDNKIFWTGSTGPDGIAIAPNTELRDPERWYEFKFIVTAEKDGDLAYVGSNWNEGVSPWMFGTNFDLSEAKPQLRGSVFPDRGVYKLGEEVHVKAVLRSDTAEGIRLLPVDSEISLSVTDSHDAQVEKKTLKLSGWGSGDWSFRLPADGALGRYTVRAKAPAQNREVHGDFLVAAYRRPDFRVDANLAGETSLAGVELTGVVTAKYLFGAAMGSRPVHWTSSRRLLHSVPRKIAERFPEERWAFLDNTREERLKEEETLQTRDASLDREGRLKLALSTKRDAGAPFEYTLEGEVTDVSRQKIAGRASFRVDPAPWYVGVKEPPYFAEAGVGFDTEIVAADLEGKSVAGVKVTAVLRQIQWHSVRRGEGKGFYTWETQKREIEAGRWDVVTAGEPAPLHVAVPRGGSYVLSAAARDSEGRLTTTKTSFYALGPGYTAWERYDHNRIDLIPEKKTYRPGETARLLIKSPWEKATALLTTEREGIRTHRSFTLDSTQQTVEVPIEEADIPNFYVSVLLVKGRTASYANTDASDPGKPSYRLGYAEIRVEDSSKHLTVAVKTDKEEYRPAAMAHVEVRVADHRGAPDSSEVTLWAVDYGVLSLTGYKTPQLVESVYVPKAIQVLNEDSRQNIVNRRVIVAKGANEGGGGGLDEGPGSAVRKDFRVLAFWLGSVVTDEQGKAAADVTLPESLTTYRVMAVVADKASRFGWAQAEIRVNKPLLLRAAFPRFLAAGDTAFFGSVLHSELAERGDAIVTMQSLDREVLEVTGEARQVVPVAAGTSAEVRFNVRARALGKARVRMSVRFAGETDAFEDVLPVEILAPPETVAAYGQANPSARETVQVPAGVLPGFGGLHVELSGTALVGLSEGARYLIDYPYGCAEQRASSAAALLLAGDLGEAFRLPGIEPAKLKDTARATLKELEAFQCETGGFALWKGDCHTVSPYLTSYVLSVFHRAERSGYEVSKPALEKAYAYLEKELGGPPPANEVWRPAYVSWQAFAVKVLTEAGRNEDSHVNRLAGYLDRMPVFALAYLFDALEAKGETGARVEDLKRRMTNAILPEGGTAHVEESSDPYLLWFWNSNVRSTAVVLESLTRHTSDQTFTPALVRWLLAVRRGGRWGNTQENAVAMGALVEYYRKFEKETPDFSSVVTLGRETLAREKFAGRSSEARARDLPMKDLLAGKSEGQPLELTFRKDGPGTLFYATRLSYAVDAPAAEGMDKGIAVERSYSPDRDGKPAETATTYKAGDLVRVTLTLRLPKERRFVAVTDPLPAGFEPVESWFATTAASLAREEREAEDESQGDWMAWWERGGFDHVERHDDRVLLFATRLSEGTHSFSYLARATTAGSFRAAAARAEEMYEPEVFGRTPSASIEVEK